MNIINFKKYTRRNVTNEDLSREALCFGFNSHGLMGCYITPDDKWGVTCGLAPIPGEPGMMGQSTEFYREVELEDDEVLSLLNEDEIRYLVSHQGTWFIDLKRGVSDIAIRYYL